ncbi:hypothetical protein ACE6H2_026903 [Prunus campanulata]
MCVVVITDRFEGNWFSPTTKGNKPPTSFHIKWQLEKEKERKKGIELENFDEHAVFCIYCDIPLKNYAMMLEHIKDNHPWAVEAKVEDAGRGEIMTCNLCSDGNMNTKAFENNNGLICHQKMVHRGSKSNFVVCNKPKCQRKFSNKSEFEDHKLKCGKKPKAN